MVATVVDEVREEVGDGAFKHGEAGTDDAGVSFDAGPDRAGVGPVGLVGGGGGGLEGGDADEGGGANAVGVDGLAWR